VTVLKTKILKSTSPTFLPTKCGHLAHAMCLWRWWFISHVIVYLAFNICSCRLQPESKLLV